VTFASPAAWHSDILTELGEWPVRLRDPVTSCQPRGSVDLGEFLSKWWPRIGIIVERNRGLVLFDMDKHNTMEKACRHLIDFIRIKEQVETVLSGPHSNWTRAQASVGFDFFLLILSVYEPASSGHLNSFYLAFGSQGLSVWESKEGRTIRNDRRQGRKKIPSHNFFKAHLSAGSLFSSITWICCGLSKTVTFLKNLGCLHNTFVIHEKGNIKGSERECRQSLWRGAKSCA